jgi:predicted PhzF superfamily epimerase YddE/YHI9
LYRTGVVSGNYLASQGSRVGRKGVIALSFDEGEVWVGGSTVTCIRGTIDT